MRSIGSGALSINCPSVHCLPPSPIPPPIFKSRKGFFLVIYDYFHHRFPNTAAFSSVPRSAVLGGTTVSKYNEHRTIRTGQYQPSFFSKTMGALDQSMQKEIEHERKTLAAQIKEASDNTAQVKN